MFAVAVLCGACKATLQKGDALIDFLIYGDEIFELVMSSCLKIYLMFCSYPCLECIYKYGSCKVWGPCEAEKMFLRRPTI